MDPELVSNRPVIILLKSILIQSIFKSYDKQSIFYLSLTVLIYRMQYLNLLLNLQEEPFKI